MIAVTKKVKLSGQLLLRFPYDVIVLAGIVQRSNAVEFSAAGNRPVNQGGIMRSLIKLAPRREAYLFSVKYMPSLQKFTLHREEGRTRGGDIVRVARIASHDHCERVRRLRQVLS